MKFPYRILLLMLLSEWAVAQAGYSDCNNALTICSVSPLAIESLPGAGADQAEIMSASCLEKPFPERNSIWIKWTIAQGGELGFTLLPAVETDDLDFILYRLDKQSADCAGRKELRCMTAGKILGETAAEEASCTGATGLSKSAADISEPNGCRESNDNFLSLVTTMPGETYLLFINNYQSANGFLMEFSGNCTFAEVPGKCLNNTVDNSAPYIHSTDNVLRFSNVYPNPASDEIHMGVSSDIIRDGRIELIDIHGRIVQSQAVSVALGEQTFSMRVHALRTGIWFLKVSAGESTCLSRFYKE